MPNLVLVMSDEARKDVVYHEKYPFARTPHLDALRREAITFSNCFANYPVCVPSRASFITGRYPHQLGVLDNRHRLPATERDLGHHLTAHGFDCVAFGKTHDTNRGFHSVTYDTGRSMGFANHGYVADPERITGTYRGATADYCDFVACRQFDEFLRARSKTRPFAAFIGIYAPHPPLYPPGEYASLYPPGEIELPVPPTGGDNACRPALQAAARRRWSAYPDATRRRVIASYLALITLLDDCVGRIIISLRESAVLEDTLLLFLSDHGDQLGEHGMAGKMGNLYEASVRVPLVLRLPGGAHAGAGRSQLVELVDLFPTICDLLGVPHPESEQRPAGRSLAPVIADPCTPHRDLVHSMVQSGQMARAADLKLNFYAGDRGELYDLRADPQELDNRYDRPEYRDRQQALLAAIAGFLIRHPRPPHPGRNHFFG